MNNQAIIAKVSEVIEIPGANTVQVSVVLGEQCVTSKGVSVGDVGILFPEGLQLSEEFVYENNLSRKSDKNKNPEKTGFFEENRRVRAQPFMKVRSTAFFTELGSVGYTGVSADDLQLGSTFNDLNGKPICKKYVNERTIRAASSSSNKARKKVETPFFKEHVDTGQFKHNMHRIKEGDILYFHAKKHGTSGRTAYTQVFHDLPWWKKAVNKVAPIFPDHTWEIVTGTRRVVLNNVEDKQGFHGSENFRLEISNKLAPFMVKGQTLYYEIVGYANGSPIMASHKISSLKNKEFTKKYGNEIVYKYGCLPGEYKFHIYRITQQCVDGSVRDLSQKELEKWCFDRQLPYTNNVFETMVYNGDQATLEQVVEFLTEREDLLTQDFEDPSHISEGIIIRVENGEDTPLFLKSKSYAFKVCEGIAAVEGIEDMEDAS